MLENVEFEVRGLSPLLCHNPAAMNHPDANRRPEGRKQAEMGVYKNKVGQFTLPVTHFRNALLYGAKSQKIANAENKRTGAVGLLLGSVFVNEDVPEMIILDARTMKPFKDYEVDTRSVIINESRVPCSRPMFRPWAGKFILHVDSAFVAIRSFLPLLVLAGYNCGVGDFRPSTRGSFGRFEVLNPKM